MILPHPETDFSTNILYVATDIIRELKIRKKNVLTEDLMQSFLNKDIKRTPDLFIKSITFLFIVGMVKYENFKIQLVKKIQPTLFDN